MEAKNVSTLPVADEVLEVFRERHPYVVASEYGTIDRNAKRRFSRLCTIHRRVLGDLAYTRLAALHQIRVSRCTDDGDADWTARCVLADFACKFENESRKHDPTYKCPVVFPWWQSFLRRLNELLPVVEHERKCAN